MGLAKLARRMIEPQAPASRARVERRTEGRMPVCWEGRLLVQAGDAPLECLVLDISTDGARVALYDHADLPERVKLHFVRAGDTLDARVVWRLGRDAGLIFAG